MEQKAKTLQFIQKRGSITQAQAKGMHVKNLRARITELRQAGHKIETVVRERLKFVNSKGQRHCQRYYVAKYVLKKLSQ